MSSGKKIVGVKVITVTTEIISTIMKFIMKKVVYINLYDLPIRMKILYTNTLWGSLSKNTLWCKFFFFLIYEICVKQGAGTCK